MGKFVSIPTSASLTALAIIAASAVTAEELEVTTESDANVLVNEVLSDSSLPVVSGSASYSGSPLASGTFTDSSGALPFANGVILSTGSVQRDSSFLGFPGDADVSSAIGTSTFDASSLTFKVQPNVSRVRFAFVFASNEFPSFVGTQFNDTFILSVNGQNVALVPGTSDTISVNTVNLDSNSTFFTDNSGRTIVIPYNGITGLSPNTLVAVADVTPGQENTVKIAIADASDGAVDSVVYVILIPEPAAAAEVAQEQSTQTEVRTFNRLISGSISNRLRQLTAGFSGGFDVTNAASTPGRSGVATLGTAAGEAGEIQIGVWADATLTKFDNTTPGQVQSGNSKTFLFGADYAVTEQILVGLIAGIETNFTHAESDNIEFRSIGGSGTIYAAYRFTDWLYASAFGSYARMKNRIENNTPFGEINGRYGSSRYSFGTEVTAAYNLEPFLVTGFVGQTLTYSDARDYNLSDGTRTEPDSTTLGQMRIGGEAAYDLGDLDEMVAGAEFFVNAAWEWDYRTTDPSSDRNGGFVRGGLRYEVVDDLFVSVDVGGQVARRNDHQYSLNANLRYSF